MIINSEVINLGKKLVDGAHKIPINIESFINQVENILSNFCWLNSTSEDIEEFRSICEDLFSIHGYLLESILKILINHLKLKIDYDEKSKNDINLITIGRFHFKNKESLRSHLRSIIHNTDDQVFLQGDDLELVHEVLKFHPKASNKLEDFYGIYVSNHENSNFRNTRTFYVSKNNGKLNEDFSYIRCLEKVLGLEDIARIEICKIIKRAFELFPSCIDLIISLLSDNFPQSRSPIDLLMGFIKSSLWLARNIQMIRLKIMKMIITHLSQLDIEIKFADPNSIDLDQMEIWKKGQLEILAQEIQKDKLSKSRVSEILGNPNWFKEMYMKIRSEEDIDQIAHKLDSIMCIIFEYIQNELNEMEPIKADEHISRLHYNESEIELNSDSNNKNISNLDNDLNNKNLINSDYYLNNQNIINTENETGKKKNWYGHSILNITMADVFVAELLEIFDQVVLYSHKSKYVQFIFFFIANLKSFWAQKFLRKLFEKVYDPSRPILERRLCVSYISSFICRSRLLPKHFTISTFKFLLEFLNEFLEFWLSDNNNNKSMQNYPENNKLSIQSNYIYPESPLSLFYTICQSLCYIFCYLNDKLLSDKQNLSLILLGENNFIEVLKSSLNPLIYCKPSIAKKFINYCKSNILFKPHEKFFKYQEVILSKHKPCDYLWVVDPLESVFPFDPYRLRHSYRFIRDKYRDWPSNVNSDVKDSSSLGLQFDTDFIFKKNSNHENNKDDPILNLKDSQICQVQTLVQDSMGFSALSREIHPKSDSETKSISSTSSENEEYNEEKTLSISYHDSNKEEVPYFDISNSENYSTQKQKVTILDLVISHSAFQAARPMQSYITNSCIQSPLQIYLSSTNKSEEPFLDGYFSPSYDPLKEQEEAKILEQYDEEEGEMLDTLLPPSADETSSYSHLRLKHNLLIKEQNFEKRKKS